MTLSIGSSRSSSGSPEPRRQQPPPQPTAAPSSGQDDEASVLQELQAAIAANPSLRAATPQPKTDEWEDFDKLMAENPDFAKPVPGREKQFYMSKDKWECGHEGEAVTTSIERDGDDQSLLTNDVRGICPTCMAKWTKLESQDEEALVGQGSSSRDPFNTGGPPAYEPAQEDNNYSDSGSDTMEFKDRFGSDSFDHRHKYLDEWNELAEANANDPEGKGKNVAHPYGGKGNDWMFDKAGDSDSDSVYEEKRPK